MDLLLDKDNIKNEMLEVEKLLYKSVKSKEAIITQATTDLLDSGGKRLRPLLTILSALYGDYDKKKIIGLATAIEIIHMATLVHDDIIDLANIRRGAPTIQSKWGKDIAVFTGDYLFCKAFLLISQYADNNDMQKLARVIKIICEGEIRQYQFRYNIDISLMDYLKRILSKTAILFKLSCSIGAYNARCNNRLIWQVSSFGNNIGMAFQITDDILDFQGKDFKMGKPVLNDFTQGIYTLPIIYSLNRGKYKKELKNIISKEVYDEKDIGKIRDMVIESGGMNYAEQLARRYLDKAEDNLKKLPKGDNHEVMGRILKAIIKRKS